MQQYFQEIEDKMKVVYSIAGQAREKGLDPVSVVEIPLARTLAERVIGLISTIYPQIKECGIEKRIRELEKKHGLMDPAVALEISEEIAKEKFCKFMSLEEGIDAGIRTAFAYLTLGVVAAPLEGYTHFKLKKTRKGENYFSVYFSGPIGGAGRTAASIFLLIVDYLREIFGYAKYDPDEKEIKRAVTEIYDRHERVTNLQYLPTEKEIEFLVKNLPIQLNGDPTEEKEVSNYKDLERIETNRIRSGFCLILGEGLAQKAPKTLKVMKILREKGFKLSDWDFLEEYVKLHEQRQEGKTESSPAYIQDLVAGRPVFGHPSRSGSFRLRYGRCRNTGYSALAVHPATMAVLADFVAIGTQLRIELPTKGAAVTTCDSIDGPVVKLNDESVVKINDADTSRKLYKDIKEVIYLGDMLVPYGDFANRNHALTPCGFNEEYWKAIIKHQGHEIKLEDNELTLEKAKELSKKYSVPLHPKFIFFWSQITESQFLSLMEWMQELRIENNFIILPYKSHEEKETQEEKERFSKAKRALEILGVEHKCNSEVIIDSETSAALLFNLGINEGIEGKANFPEKFQKIKKDFQEIEKRGDVLSFINQIAPVQIKDKAGTFIGARMGRPEKAKLRKLTGSPHVLFPVGDEGGRLRSVQEAASAIVEREFPSYYCNSCKKETIYYVCETCGNKTQPLYYCPVCSRFVDKDEHKDKEHKLHTYSTQKIDIQHYLDCAMQQLNLNKDEVPVLIKGVRGTSSESHVPEHIAKGILRAQFNVHVNKDGTIRYDATELPITHFKPCEIGTDFSKLVSLGYIHDIHNKPLESNEQILEIKPQDIILPACSKTLDEKADDVFVNVSKFIDNLLVRFYGLQPFYNIESGKDLVGHLVLCMAPHNCAGVAGRIIGFSEAQALLASPYFHAAMRRDCDGDEAAIMLLLDALLNFSRSYLPAHRGGTQDAPLVLNARIRAGEVDDMILDVDVSKEIPFELYEAAEKFIMPNKIKMSQIKERLGGNEEFRNLFFTHDVSNINNAPSCSAYKTLATMQEKVAKQMEIVSRLRSVDEDDVARLIIERHFIRDIRGNLRKFSTQQFRCVKCNDKFRRPPLSGKCSKCGGKIIFTIAEGSIKKYLEPALELARKYKVPAYLRQSLELTKSNIESVFGRETEKQQTMEKWF